MDCGITTLVGVLGTDSISRSLPNLLTKLNALSSEGINSYMWTGGYRFPSPTLTNSVQTDLLLIDKVIGVGEVCISDHRSSFPSFEEIKRLVSDARIGGMLSGKAGKVHFHVGSASSGLTPLWELVHKTAIPISQMHPTHMSSRGDALLQDAKKWIECGGFIDFTADEGATHSTVNALVRYKHENVSLNSITISSDAYGSFPIFNEDKTEVIDYGMGLPTSLFTTFKRLVFEHNWKIEEALPFFTSTPATYLQFQKRGILEKGNFADLLVLNNKLDLQYVFANGTIMKTPTYTKKSIFAKL